MCTYLRLTNSSGRVHCALVAAKARVAPMKVVSIPRLELTAAVGATQIGATVKHQLKIEIHEEYFWTDSTVVLGYINNDAKRFHVFVSNRVQKIKNLTAPEQWRHVSTEDNPADHASRGLSLTQLKDSNWFTGPQWLWNSELSVTPHEIPSLQPQDPEVKICLQLSSKAPETLDWNERLKHMSSWTKAKAVVARLKKIANGGRDSGPIGPEEVRKAENQILRNIQQHAFPELYDKTKRKSLSKKHPLYKAEPFLHEGLVRAGGRNQGKEIPIEQRNPIILPKCHVANLIIQHCHEKIKHQGIGFTLNEIRSHGFWILGAYQTVSKIIRNCSICARLRGRPCEQRMADLPPERIEASPPFTHVGMDCFGPVTVKNGRKETKRYGLLFTCMCSRAVHIEMLDDLTTDAFINGLRCFISIRGQVQKIFCDQGTNFIGADAELHAIPCKNLPHNFKECEFVFNVPHASHAGGVWERQVRTVKNVLNAIITLESRGRLDDASLRTFLYETMSIVNSRPLTAIYQGDPTSLEPITPNHVLTMKSKVPSPPPGPFVQQDVYLRKRWRRVQYLLEQFWARWKKEYVANISRRQKWVTPRPDVKVDDLALIVDDNLPRSQWKLGIVTETYPSKDGLIRKVRLQMATHELDQKGRRLKDPTFLERPIQKLVLLHSFSHSPRSRDAVNDS